MILFSIICLVIIMFGIQHLLNWMWRKSWREESLVGSLLVLTIFGIAISVGIIYTIILWGKNLI